MNRKFKRTAFIWNINYLLHYKYIYCYLWQFNASLLNKSIKCFFYIYITALNFWRVCILCCCSIVSFVGYLTWCSRLVADGWAATGTRSYLASRRFLGLSRVVSPLHPYPPSATEHYEGTHLDLYEISLPARTQSFKALLPKSSHGL